MVKKKSKVTNQTGMQIDLFEIESSESPKEDKDYDTSKIQQKGAKESSLGQEEVLSKQREGSEADNRSEATEVGNSDGGSSEPEREERYREPEEPEVLIVDPNNPSTYTLEYRKIHKDSIRANHAIELAEAAQERCMAAYLSTDWAEYGRIDSYLADLLSQYRIMKVVAPNTLGDLRVELIRACIKEQNNCDNLYDKMEITRGDKIVDEVVLAEEKRMRLLDQLELVNKALA